MNIPRPLMILILGFLVVTLAAHAQPVGNVARLGYISGADPQLAASSLEAFRQGRRALGWIEGQNLRIEYRWAHGEFERFPQFAADLVHLKVDVIVASGPAALRALQQATSSIPIVSAVVLEHTFRTPRMAPPIFSPGHFSHAPHTLTMVCCHRMRGDRPNAFAAGA